MSPLIACLIIIASVYAKSQYKVTNVIVDTSKITLNLVYTGNDSYYLKPTSPIIKTLQFVFQVYTFSDFSFKITNPNNKRFEVPQNNIIPTDPFANFTFPLKSAGFVLSFELDPFEFKIIRKSNGALLFSTEGRNFIYSDHYIQIGTEVQSEYLYGLGQRFSHNFRIKDGKWTMFTREQGFTFDQGNGKNAYGYYPFYLIKEQLNHFHVNYFRSSNAMDVFKSTEMGRHFLTYKVIGGILDFRFFLGEENPELTIQKFSLYSGNSAIPPFWSLGFHQARWGYQNITYLTDVIENYEKYGIPLDAIWTDIDYLVDLEDFTIDEEKFPLDQMNKIRQKYKWVPIIDAGIKAAGPAYEDGLKRDVYMKEPNGKPYVGKVWPGDTTFVDFFHPNATQYWIDMLNVLYEKIPFDGLWIDMNEIDNFCNGPCHTPTDPSVFDYSKDLPYNPGNDSIESQTVSLNCTHYGNITQANVHIYHGLLQVYASNAFFKSKNVRPFMITRSSTIGSGRYSFHWTGDNFADWDFLKESIPHTFNAQMFGFQMVGSDICGFGGDTTEELCARWFQLGTLYPFSRNHNILGTISQQPYALGPIVLQASTKAIKLRYSLLNYIYTLFVNKSGLGPIWKPLFFNYPLDSHLYLDEIADTQFLIGNDLLVAPILQEGQTSRKVYFPGSNWYEFHTGKLYAPGTTLITDYKLTDKIPLFIKQGSIISIQDVSNVTSTKHLSNKFHLIAGFSLNQKKSTDSHQYYQATGNLLSISNYNEDSKVERCLSEKCFYSFNLILIVESSRKMLEIDISYIGGANLNELIIIREFTLYYSGAVINFKLQHTLQVTGPLKTTIEIQDISSNLRIA